MKILFCCLIAVAATARLENTYLPPGSAGSAGGHGSFLAAPFRQSHFGSTASSAFKQLPIPIAIPQANKFAETFHQEKTYPLRPNINILRFENVNDGFGSYSYGYDTENHIQAHETGQLKNIGGENEANTVHGSFSYKGDDGADYTVEYTADENGFQARGAHLPVPPPIPEAILKSLELNAASASDNDDGQYREKAYQQQYLPPQKPSFDRHTGYRY
ncbi:endocuticle structural glycoprotein SgAbd-2-like isoform X2 [Photinus pyralis]|uniref:endocuticle structural glycoprotein SgAbd-2-like isoform X2 n=1 Tax=Photinus pyralis TaxID=7054 RepID=UPI00126752BF|nr:endocuticle structural glycoprotein SgAbd-2-like isoform X2 [Photinus pyralis]